jgi:hypothetical protein
MKRYLRIAIEAGETTCEHEKGKSCVHVGIKQLGLEFVCMLFSDSGERKLLRNANGSLARLPECMQAEVNT